MPTVVFADDVAPNGADATNKYDDIVVCDALSPMYKPYYWGWPQAVANSRITVQLRLR